MFFREAFFFVSGFSSFELIFVFGDTLSSFPPIQLLTRPFPDSPSHLADLCASSSATCGTAFRRFSF